LRETGKREEEKNLPDYISCEERGLLSRRLQSLLVLAVMKAGQLSIRRAFGGLYLLE